MQLVQAQVAETFGPRARAFGWNGQAALLEAWNRQRGTQQRKRNFYDGFAVYYQAGLTGENMDQVSIRYTWMLTEPQKQAAYRAGRRDAAAFAARGRSAVNPGQVLGRELTSIPTTDIIDSSISQDLTDTESGTGQDTVKLHDGEQSEPSARLGQGVTESGPQKPGTVKHIGTVDFSNKRAVLHQLMQAQTDFAGLDYEMNCTITSDGKVWRVSGTSGQVSPWGIEALGSSLRGSYSYHNHPPKDTWYSFSAADVRFFFASGEAYATASDDEYEYFMQRTEDTLDVDPEVAYSRFKEIHDSPEVLKMLWNETIDPDRDRYHMVMEILSRELKFRYERKKEN